MIRPIIDTSIEAMGLIMSISKVIDCTYTDLANHHLRVGYISSRISHTLCLSGDDISRLIIASTFHDIGFFTLKERLEAFQFEYENPEHAERGFAFLCSSPLFGPYAEIIRYHHTPYTEIDVGKKTQYLANIIFLADRIDVFLRNHKINMDISDNDKVAKELIGALKKQSGSNFHPDFVTAVEEIIKADDFWFDLEHIHISEIMMSQAESYRWLLKFNDFQEFSHVFSKILDWRSPFTVTHSAGVKAVAVALADTFSFSETGKSMMAIAGDLHDIGKLGIPLEILHKPGPLTTEEFQVIKKHVYLTYTILSPIKELYTVTLWASLHHERLTGDGYPFRLSGKDLTLGSRIMAIADVFTALMETRPYKPAMDLQTAVRIVKDMAHTGKLCRNVVNQLEQHLNQIDEARVTAQKEAMDHYRNWRYTLENIKGSCSDSKASSAA